jgi:BirA family biotin operon repressor/biotin-[acetyl-CoA-carboxylase] ligase
MATLTTSILRFESLGSTNTEAASWAMQGAPEGLCVVAREQTAGRGRLERPWASPKDAGLYFSIILRPQLEQKTLPLITLMASLAVRDALKEACELDTDIKWPNDVLANDRKICGILAEVVDTSIGRSIITGIGINLSAGSFPSELESTATSVEHSTGVKPDLEVVLESLIKALCLRYLLLQSAEGAETILHDWCQASSFAEGKRVRIDNSGETVEGITRGLEFDGALRIETDLGEIKVVRAGDVTVVREASRLSRL